ncbi:hypothetical protein E2C01_024313 [Portunus trituberculatus]|uniref:Uncharacterized protein n=1 Tax=Portunus trituberculatus TaxID=210409 RepID=A0A5B7ECG7_PORTR|nr:hypothetical protein [Portunus trituberculatus]
MAKSGASFCQKQSPHTVRTQLEKGKNSSVNGTESLELACACVSRPPRLESSPLACVYIINSSIRTSLVYFSIRVLASQRLLQMCYDLE